MNLKNYKSLTLLVLGMLFLSINAYSQTKEIALVSFFCDKKIGGSGMSTVGESLINDPNFNLKPALTKAYDKFVNEFAKDFPFKLMDKNTVTNNEEYKKYESRFLMDTSKNVNKLMGIQYVLPEGYIFAFPCAPCLVGEEKRDECNLSKIFNTADGTMFVFLDYEIESRMQGFAAGVTAYITIAVYDKSCNKVFRIREYGKSSKKVAAVAGVPVMKSDKILPLCEDATEQLFKELDGKLSKIVKKSAKL